MAAADPVKNIKDQVTCSICLDLFRDPVTSECGHSFCKECIAQYCKEEDIDIACPQCKKKFQKRNLRLNRELKNIVESLSIFLSSQTEEKLGGGNMCKRHHEPLKFYCKEDQTPICVVCERSQAHRTHTVIPMEEAVQEYRETITDQLGVIESNFQKLHQFVNKIWKHLPQKAQEEEHKRLKTLIDKVAILFKVKEESTRKRFTDRASQTQPPDSELKSFFPERKIAVETELHGQEERENIREEVSEKQETGSHVIRICEEAPTPKYGLDHASLDPTIHRISNTTKDDDQKVDVKSPSTRSEDLPPLIPSVKSGGRRKDSVSPGGNVVVQAELQGCEEKGGQVSEEQKHDATCDHKEAKTPMGARRKDSLSDSREQKQMDVKSLRSRFEVSISPSPSVESGGRRKDSVSPGGNVATQNELQKCEEKGGQVSEEQKEAATCVHKDAETPVLMRKKVSFCDSGQHKQMYGRFLSKSLQDLTSDKAMMAPGGRRKDRIYLGRNEALQTEPWVCEEKGGQMSEEQKEAATCVHKKAETPVLTKGDLSSPDPREHKQVDINSFSKRLQNLTYVKEGLSSGRKRKDRVSPGWNVAMPTELQGCEVDVTLNPATAHPLLIVSEDRKSMRYGDKWQDLPNNPERFNVSVSALGSEGFTSGRHYWEVEVGAEGQWAIGVARDSVYRKGRIFLQSHLWIWALTYFEISQCLQNTSRKIGVYLNYERGEVRFYNAEDMALISTLTAEFKGKVVPFFLLWTIGSHIKLSTCQR